MPDLQLYLETGIVESYVLGLVNAEDAALFERLCGEHPELAAAKQAFQDKLEFHAFSLAKAPPLEVRERVWKRIVEFPEMKVVYRSAEAAKDKVGAPLSIWKRFSGWLGSFFDYPFSAGAKNDHVNESMGVAGIQPVVESPPQSPDFCGEPYRGELRNKPLLMKILANREGIDQLNWFEFEVLIFDLVTILGYTAQLTPKTRDGGKDLVVFRHTSFGDWTFYMECKLRTSKRKVEAEVVQKLYGAVTRDRVTAGIVVTNSYFSPAAIRFQKPLSNTMKLINRDVIFRWIDLINKGGPFDDYNPTILDFCL